jgi:ubiquinone/menaquinone biosynthesis C-methylase UbiE
VRKGASRDREQKPDEIIAALGIKPGDHVADVGAGAGYMLPFLSRAVSPGGLVYEQDISSEALGRAKERAARLKIENVRFILGDAKDPHLPKGEIDSVLVLDAYHHFEFAQEMLEQIRTALKPGGRLAIVDFFKRGGMANHVRLDRDEVIKQVESFGWKLEASPDFLTNQYILIFIAAEKPETAGMLLDRRA